MCKTGWIRPRTEHDGDRPRTDTMEYRPRTERGMEYRYAQLAASRQQQFVRLRQDLKIAPERAYPPFLRGNEPLMAEGDENAARFRGRGSARAWRKDAWSLCAPQPSLARFSTVMFWSQRV